MKDLQRSISYIIAGIVLTFSLSACAPRSQSIVPSPEPSPVPDTSQAPEVLDPNPGKACTLEAKICPDGSTVGRTGPNCEFAACPPSSSTAPGVTPILYPSNK